MPPSAGDLGAGGQGHTHVGDHVQFPDVGGLGVQELPHGLLLVTLPPGQLLEGGQARSAGGRAGEGPREGQVTLPTWVDGHSQDTSI